MHRKILFGIIAAVVCGLFVSSPSAQAGGVVTSASRYQFNGLDYWKFYYDDSSSTVDSTADYWIDGNPVGSVSQQSGYFQIAVASGTYGWNNNAIYVGGTNPFSSPPSDNVHRASYVIFHPDGSYEITLQW